MARKFVLYFGAGAHRLYRWRRAGLEPVASFGADDDAGPVALREFLRAAPGALVALVADLTGEDFHEDQIPFLRGADRAAVVQRRLAQRFRDARLATALSLGVVVGERRTERLLLASFANGAQFAPWLEAIAGAGARLAGVYSAPLLAPALAARLGVRTEPAILVTVNASGLRQCYLDHGRLRFARLEPAADLSPDALAAFVRSETLRLADYLATLRALPREGPPAQAIVVAPDGMHDAFAQTLEAGDRVAFRTLAMSEVARRLGLRRLAPGAGAEQLYLHLALRRPPKEQFARREERRAYMRWQTRRAIVAAGGAAFAACALYAASLWLDVLDVRAQTATQQREAQQATREHERITATFPVTQTTTENLRIAVLGFREIAERSASPEAALAHLSRALEQFPQIELDALVWRVDAPREPSTAQPGATPPTAAPVGADAKPPARVPLEQSLEISGRVEAIQRSDYRAITEAVRRFAHTLAGTGGWRVVATKLPFDIAPEATLSGDFGTDAGSGDAPRFTVTIARTVP
ncbi:MAG: hypothetical protein RML56_01270 [Burkholderiales bacterium]|nr:hypothetical protein [Burkholderiales bacterium]